MTMDLFTAMQQLHAINGGNTADNSVNENISQQTGFTTGQAQPFQPQVGANVPPVGANMQQPQAVTNAQPVGANMQQPQATTNTQPFGANMQQPQAVTNAQPFGANMQQPQAVTNAQPFGANMQQPQAVTNAQPFGANMQQPQATTNVQPVESNANSSNLADESLASQNSTNQAIGFISDATSSPQQAPAKTEEITNNTEATKKTTAKKSSSKKTKDKDKDNKNSVYIYERDIEMAVKYGGIERFKMPLKLELHGMDEFEYIKNKLAEMGVTAAKKENFVIEEQDDYFRLIKVAREQTRYHSKG